MIYHSYELFLHWKQGDDFASCLEKSSGNASKALILWAEQFESNALACRGLASRMESKDIEAQADTHLISFSGDEELLETLAKEGLLSKQEFEDKEENEPEQNAARMEDWDT